MRRIIAALTALALLGGCADGVSPSSETAEPASITVIAQDLEAPWSIAFHGQSALISERDSARVLELLDDGSTREVAIIDGVRAAGEGGLLGLAVYDGYLYTYYTSESDNRIDRFAIGGEPGALSLGDGQRVIDGIPSATNHNGGRIAFGPDGMLYVTAGDASYPDSAQDTDALGGKILRMTPTGGVPTDNPIANSLVYSYGHRNPQGLAWDEAGNLYSSEFGQNTWDELNVIVAGGNYGWPLVEGIAEDDRYIDPVQQWDTKDASPSGMAISDGSIYIANLRGERLRQIPISNPSTSVELLVGEYGRLRDAVAAPDGTIWVLTNNTDGRGEPEPSDDRILAITLD